MASTPLLDRVVEVVLGLAALVAALVLLVTNRQELREAIRKNREQREDRHNKRILDDINRDRKN